MKMATVAEAEVEARKFLKFVKELRKKADGFDYADSYPREAGLVRAQSIILTRKLADMRRGN